MKSSLAAKHTLPITAWVVMLIVSDLPDMLITWLGGSVPSWMFWAKAAFLAVFFGLTRMSKAIRPLWQYALALFTLFLALGLTSLLRGTAWFQGHFNYRGVSFFKGYRGGHDPRHPRRPGGDRRPVAHETRPQGLLSGQGPDGRADRADPLAGHQGRGVVEDLHLDLRRRRGPGRRRPDHPRHRPLGRDAAARPCRFCPPLVLLAAVNAFTEEAYFRCSLLSTLHDVIGRTHTLLLILVFFGLSHWLYGSPTGLVGFAMTGFLSWIMAKSMLETKGMLSPWLIHFFPDVVVFFSYALAYVKSNDNSEE